MKDYVTYKVDAFGKPATSPQNGMLLWKNLDGSFVPIPVELADHIIKTYWNVIK